MKTKAQLPQKARVITALIYISILILLYKLIGGDYRVLYGQQSNDNSIWFFSGALMIVLGRYIVEAYFTKPADALTNSFATLIALISLSHKSDLVLFNAIVVYSSIVFVASIYCIVTKDSIRSFWKVSSQFTYKFVGLFGKADVIFSIIYLSASYSYFAKPDNYIPFIITITFWIVIVFFDLVGILVERLIDLNIFSKGRLNELGIAIGCENPLLYSVEVDLFKKSSSPIPQYGDLVAVETSQNIGSVGMIIDIKYLLSKKWLSVYLLRDETGLPTKINLISKKIITDPKSIFSQKNYAYLLQLEQLLQEDQEKIKSNTLFRNKLDFVGYVTEGSNINTINFSIFANTNIENKVSEGGILKTTIYDVETLYQIINGNTREEHLENFDSHGFVVGIARKLGRYNYTDKTLSVVKWVPTIYSPVFLLSQENLNNTRLRELANTSIGRLPSTDFEVRINDINALVTHNTAILGILGIGKSCLAYEIIKKVSDSAIKVICIDITNEYKKELPDYLESHAIISDDENAFNNINTNYENIYTEGTQPNLKEVPDKSGNVIDYKKSLHINLCQFLFSRDEIPADLNFDTTKKVRIYNPDYHKVSKGEKIGYKVITTDLTQAEKTRAITEELFKILMKIPLADEKNAKVLVVFEEAHSLIPEWNSVASEGDKTAVNGTAKIILQGRKYGLGSLIITQRTANISKSILNQCNTIFALRVFDDTGKEFLSNYIGRDYADTLATLEERHAIAIGKGIKLKQPVIIQLNQKENLLPLPSETPN